MRLTSSTAFFAEMAARTDLPPDVQARRCETFGRLRLLLGERRAAFAELHRRGVALAEAAAEEAAALGFEGDIWAMAPERPHREPGTAPGRRPRPLYYGYDDTGYRISLGGKRSRSGLRVGRRAFETGGRSTDRTAPALSRWGGPISPSGQAPVPPCLIWCPVCGSLNDVPTPPGFVVETAGTEAPSHLL